MEIRTYITKIEEQDNGKHLFSFVIDRNRDKEIFAKLLDKFRDEEIIVLELRGKR